MPKLGFRSLFSSKNALGLSWAENDSSISSPKASDSLPAGFSPYKYTPLDPNSSTIRLVILEKELLGGHTPMCRIIHKSFAERPECEALSYTWGYDTTKKWIKLDGFDFAVTTNLFNVLRYQCCSDRHERICGRAE